MQTYRQKGADGGWNSSGMRPSLANRRDPAATYQTEERFLSLVGFCGSLWTVAGVTGPHSRRRSRRGRASLTVPPFHVHWLTTDKRGSWPRPQRPLRLPFWPTPVTGGLFELESPVPCCPSSAGFFVNHFCPVGNILRPFIVGGTRRGLRDTRSLRRHASRESLQPPAPRPTENANTIRPP